MADKKTETKAPAKKAAPKAAAPKPGRPPKVAEITELDLGPKLVEMINNTAQSLGVERDVVVRALTRKGGEDLRRVGPIGIRMALRRYL
jgi:hypothetical protein